MFRITSNPLDPDALRRELLDTQAGGYVAFEGRVRSRNEGREVRSLEYETYLELAEKEGARVLAEAGAKYAILLSRLCASGGTSATRGPRRLGGCDRRASGRGIRRLPFHHR